MSGLLFKPPRSGAKSILNNSFFMLLHWHPPCDLGRTLPLAGKKAITFASV